MIVASLLVAAAPASAEEAPSAPTETSIGTTGTTVDAAPNDSAPVTSTTAVSAGLEASALVTGAATASRTPMRGAQVQLMPPPPPPDDPFVPPVDGQTGRRIVYSKTKQTVWVYDESNTIIKMHRVSGRQDPRDPSPGVYRVWSRSLHTFAIHNPSITWNYMIRFAKGDRDGNIGFHDIPYQYGQPVQTVDQLGQALSGGCVRQAPEDAIWMWNWAGIGTVVVVTP